MHKTIANTGSRSTGTCLLAVVLLCSTGCEEHRKLDTDLNKAREEMKLLQTEEDKAQGEIQRLGVAYSAVRDHTAIRKGGFTLEQKVAALTEDLNKLKQRKMELEESIESLNQQGAALRQKNP